MTTTTRGKHRRSFWLGVGPVVVLLMLLALAAAPTAVAAPGVQTEYGGTRWKHADRAVCITTKNIRTTAVKDAVKRSAYYWTANTKLDVRLRYDCAELGYSQRVEVYDRYYDKKNPGWIERKGGRSWTKVPTAGSWTQDGWTYVFKSPVYVKINRNYMDRYSSHKRQHVVSHELGHALGLGHNGTCSSVMVKHWDCDYMYKYGGWRDWTGTVSNPGINTIYAKG